VHAIAYAINAALGNLGRRSFSSRRARPPAASIGDLAAAIRGGTVKTLVILGGNPVYNRAGRLGLGDLQKSVPEVIRLGYHPDETSAHAGVNLAAAHFLESWGDARTLDGTIVRIQPMNSAALRRPD